MKVGIEFSGNKGSKSFIGLSFRVSNSAEIGSTPLDFVDPEVSLRSRECMVFIMFFPTPNDFDSMNVLIHEEFENIALFNFHLLDTFCAMGGLLSA
jgi:hypothetical protein